MYKTPYLPQGSFFSSNLDMFASQTNQVTKHVGLVILKAQSILKTFVRTLSQLKIKKEMSPVRSFLPVWADGLKRGCGGQQGWISQDWAALDAGWGSGFQRTRTGALHPHPASPLPLGGREDQPMRLLQREKRPKRRTPPAQAAGLRALLL